jgi:voltage-gated sodium channel
MEQDKDPDGPKPQLEREDTEYVTWEEVPWIDRPQVDVAIGCVIFLNAILMGVELDSSDREVTEISDRLFWYVIEILFALVFLAELCARVYVHHFAFFKTAMNCFDALLVALTILDTFILSPMSSGGSVRVVGALRVIRMMRLVRLVRLLPRFKELWLIVNGLAHSLKTLAWVSLLLSVTLYFFAIFATQQIGQNDEIYNEYFETSKGAWDHEKYFGTVPRAMFSLFQICTLDRWSENIVRHVRKNQNGMEWLFVSFICFATFGLLNLVIGVVVENTLASAKVNETKMKKKREKDRMRVLNHLREFFEQSDEDGSGTLTMEEIQQAMKDPEALNKLKLIDLPLDDPNEIFTLLDVDQSGELSIDEFISGCMRIKGNAKSKDLLAVQIAVDTLGSKFQDLTEALNEAGSKIMSLDDRTSEMMMSCERVFLPEREARRRNNDFNEGYEE